MIRFDTKHCLVGLLAAVSTMMQAAGTVLPHFKAADSFGGRSVDDLTLFVPTCNDFTLEAEAKAGNPISIGFSHVSYTPSQDGVVRFVQQDGLVYVFENNAYVTSLTPEYDYSVTGQNIVRNGSFESVSEQLSSGRWMASDWNTWDGGTPTWGGDVGYVNVRENDSKCSDGKKSVILHSRSKWLCQQLTSGALEAGETYCLMCDYWTSDGAGNGNGAYEIWLGSSLATDDVLTLEGYTTPEGDYSKHSFTTIFQAPQTLPADLFLSFYREQSKVDWLDNVRLVKISPEGKGVTGTARAIYRTGAYAPQSMTLPEGTYIDMTGSLANPDFADGTMVNSAPAGWTLDANVTQSKISTGDKGGLISASQNHWQLWHSSGALTGQAHQTLKNLPNGRYVLAADVVTSGFGGKISLYANYGKTSVASSAAKRYQASGIVTDGTLDVGLDFATTGGVTIDFDSFTLQYEGMDIDGYREVLALRVDAARKVAEHVEDGYDASPINEAVANAKALGSDAEAAEIIDAIAAIDKSLEDYQTYVDKKAEERKGLENFKALVAASEAERKADAYPGAEAFDAAIEKAKAFLNQLEADISLPVTEHADALNAAREAYYNSQYAKVPVQQTVSYVDLSLNGSEKYVLRVDGKPYYGTEIQMRPDKLRGYEGWNDTEIEAAFKRAAQDGFNTLSVPLFWSEVELEKNHFDWRILDTYLGWCKKYGVRAEILWFSWSSGGRVQWLWNGVNGRYQLRTPDYVCSSDGKSEFNMLRTQWEYSLDWRDQNLINREIYVLGRVMEHIALWDANNGNPHTVIGVQLGNEARAHGGNSATSAEIIDYYHKVGAAVKQSKYVTWTRLNCVSYETSGRTSANESKRNSGGTNIDFVGIDVYGTNAGSVKGDINGQLGANGKNYRMIMEIDAKDSWSPIYQMAALAGNKAFDYYNMGPVDGNGLYANNGHVLTERSHISLVRQRNKILNLANQDIALYKHGGNLYVYNYSAQNSNEETGLAGIVFKPDANNTQAIAVRHASDKIALLSTSKGVFTLPASLKATSAEQGHFDENNRWVKEADVAMSGNSITMPATSCVLVYLNGSESQSGLVTWGDGTGQSWDSPVAGPYYSGSKILLNGATVTLGDAADTKTTWSYNSGNAGLLPTQMPSVDGTASALVTTFSEAAPFGTLPKHGCFLKIEAHETGTLSIGCKPSTDAAQQLVFVTMDGDDVASAKVISSIWDSSYSFDVEAGKTYLFFQLSKAGKLDSYRFTLRSVAFLMPGQKAVKVFTIGDSTMANKSSATERGWGMLFPKFVQSSLVTVSNHAADGRSTKSFIDEGRWTAVANQLAEGDYVLIQFGHNDEKTDGSLHTDPQTTYKQNLSTFVKETRAKKANPVLLTPIVRRMFGADGNIVHEHEEYAKAVRELAEELDVPLIDMTLLSSQYENAAGIEGSRALHEYFPGKEIDNTHLCQLGAYVTARCVAEQIVADDRIGIAIAESPETLEGAYASTVDFARHAAGMPSFEGTLAELDEAVRQQRLEARLSLDGDATFTLVNPDFAEGFCWYNAVQATRPMGWTLSGDGAYNVKSSNGAKPEGASSPVIASGQDHLQLWGINGNVCLEQTANGIADGRYELTVAVCKSGSLTAALFANEASSAVVADGECKVIVDVVNHTLRFGLKIASTAGASIDIDDFTLRRVGVASGVQKINAGAAGETTVDAYTLGGARIANDGLRGYGVVVRNGRKFINK